MTEVQLEDGTVLEFPDGVSQDEIQEYVNRSHPPKMVPIESIMSSTRAGPTPANLARQKAASMGPFRRSLYGAERALDEAAMGAKQIVAGLSPEEEQNLSIRRQVEDQIPGSWISRIAGETALYAAPSMRAVQLANKLRQGSQVARYGAGVGTGAGIGASRPVIGNESRGVNAALGGALALGGQFAGDTLSTLLRGMAPKSQAASALPEAVQDKLSLGQSVDTSTLPGKVLATTEEKLTSVPVIGDAVANRRAGGVDAWREDLLNRVSPEGFSAAGDNTREKLASIYGEYGKRYAAALRGQTIPPSRLFESQMLKIGSDPKSGVPSDVRQKIVDDTMEYYRSMFHGNTPPSGPAGVGVVPQGGHRGTTVGIDAENAKGFEAFLAGKARQYRKAATTPGSEDIAKMYENMERAWSVAYRRSLPSSSRKSIKDLDKGYAPYKTVERAAEAVGNDGGNFTPDQLLNAVKARTPGPKFARQQGILQPEAQNARIALKNRVPNSGSTDRAITFSALAGLLTNPVETAATLGMALPATSTKIGRDFVLGETKAQKLAQKLRMDKFFQEAGLPAAVIGRNVLIPEDTLE